MIAQKSCRYKDHSSSATLADNNTDKQTEETYKEKTEDTEFCSSNERTRTTYTVVDKDSGSERQMIGNTRHGKQKKNGLEKDEVTPKHGKTAQAEA